MMQDYVPLVPHESPKNRASTVPKTYDSIACPNVQTAIALLSSWLKKPDQDDKNARVSFSISAEPKHDEMVSRCFVCHS